MDDQFDVLRVEGLIDKLFNSYVDSDTKKQYKDEGTLKRLMAIEMTFDRLLQYKQEIIENPEYKDIKELVVIRITSSTSANISKRWLRITEQKKRI